MSGNAQKPLLERILCCNALLLVFWYYTLVSHYFQRPALDHDRFPLRFVIHWFNPGGVSIYFV